MNDQSSKNKKRVRFRFSIAHLLALTGLVALHITFPSLWLVWSTLCIALVLTLIVSALATTAATAADTLELSIKNLLPIFGVILAAIFALAFFIAYR